MVNEYFKEKIILDNKNSTNIKNDIKNIKDFLYKNNMFSIRIEKNLNINYIQQLITEFTEELKEIFPNEQINNKLIRFSFMKKNEEYFGTFLNYENILEIDVNVTGDIKIDISTMIHEYTHLMQD